MNENLVGIYRRKGRPEQILESAARNNFPVKGEYLQPGPLNVTEKIKRLLDDLPAGMGEVLYGFLSSVSHAEVGGLIQMIDKTQAMDDPDLKAVIVDSWMVDAMLVSMFYSWRRAAQSHMAVRGRDWETWEQVIGPSENLAAAVMGGLGSGRW